MPGALKCLAVCLNKYWNSSRCYATSEWVAKMVILWYAGWKATAQKDRENLSYSQVASTSESKPGPKSCRALVLLVSNELGKHIWWYVVYTGLWLFTKVLVGDALLSVSPDIKMWYWDHWGRLSAFPSPSPDMLSGWLLQWFIQSNSTCGMEPFSLLTVTLAPTCKWAGKALSLAPIKECWQKMLALLGLVLSKVNSLPHLWICCCSFIKEIHEMAEIFQGRWRRLSIL